MEKNDREKVIKCVLFLTIFNAFMIALSPTDELRGLFVVLTCLNGFNFWFLRYLNRKLSKKESTNKITTKDLYPED
jgi:hypothetical protein